MITKIHTEKKNFQVYVSQKGGLIASRQLSASNTPEDLKVIKIKEGKAYLSHISCGAYIFYFSKDRLFEINSGEIVYVGDWYVTCEGSLFKNNDLSFRVIDNEENTLNDAKQNYPWIFEKMSYRKDIPQLHIDKVDDFKEVDELKQLKEQQQSGARQN